MSLLIAVLGTEAIFTTVAAIAAIGSRDRWRRRALAAEGDFARFRAALLLGILFHRAQHNRRAGTRSRRPETHPPD